MATEPRTSLTHPLEVGWLPTGWLGQVGLTVAPGKKQPNALSGTWDRDLASDLARLREVHKTDHLVCLLEDEELHELQIPDLVAAAELRGIAIHRLPIRDVSTPGDHVAVRQLVARIAGWAAAGETVVIHCKGGLGRAGTIGGCVLRAAGMDAVDTFEALVNARGKNCPETNGQRDYIAHFTPGPATKTSRILGSVLGAAIGDAMGHPTEFIRTMEQIRSKYGADGVQGFELYWTRDGQRFAPYTDDTQMAEIVLRTLVEGERAGSGLDETMKHMASGFAEWNVNPQGGHRAPGGACQRGAGRLAHGVPWSEAGGATDGGCGSVMRLSVRGRVRGRHR